MWPVLVVDADHMIFAGEARVEAARRLGFKRVPALIAADKAKLFLRPL
ncbi:hypothetical protein [Sphingobium sp. EM0848]|nr:hypothetical protein [Sphingobium sp. EM0848]